MRHSLLVLAFLPVLFAQSAETVLYAATDAGVFKSRNTGRTWQKTSEGLEGVRVSQVVAGRRNDSRVAWAATDGGVFGTIDGERWTRSLNEPRVTSIAIDPADDQRVYAAASGKLFTTANGGREWTTVPAPFTAAVVATDPFSSHRLYISATHNYDQTFATSTDRGQSWRAFGWTTAFPFIATDSSTPGRLYTSMGALLQSNDYGQSWNDLGPDTQDLYGVLPEGANFAHIRRIMAVATDPLRPGDVHTCIEARWVRLDDPEDILGPSTSGVVAGWASRLSGLWAAGSLPGDQQCTAVVQLAEEDATLYAAGTRVYRRNSLLTRRVDMVADLGSPVRALAAIREEK